LLGVFVSEHYPQQVSGTRSSKPSRRAEPVVSRTTSPGLSGAAIASTGPVATAVWLGERGLFPVQPKWSVEITLRAGRPDTVLLIEIFAEEWGFQLRHDGRQSWIRVTDVRFVHGRDDHELLAQTRSLRSFGTLVRDLEQRVGVHFDRAAATITTTLDAADAAIRAWVVAL
jgi:hypothetical protein